MTDERTGEQAQGAAPAVEAGGAPSPPPPPAEPAAAPTPSAAPSATPPAAGRTAAAVAPPPPARAPAAPAPTPPEENGGMSMAYGETFVPLKEGAVGTGTVVHIDREGVLVDVGTKSDGLIPPNELSRDPGAQDVVKIGQKVDVYVMDVDDQEGNLILSK